MYYNVPVTISKQEDGLWRVEAPALQGCFVDARTLEQALADIQGGIAMYIDLYLEEGRELPEGLAPLTDLPFTVNVAVAPSEFVIKRRVKRQPARA